MPVRSDAFADYVEAVFRRQNSVATELADAIDDELPASERFTELEQLELDLEVACRGLNQLAQAQRDGEPVGGLGGLKRARGAPDCEGAAARAARGLDQPGR